MSDNKKKFPRSDFGKSVGEEVTLFLAEVDELASLELPLDGNKITGRLVGVDRPGVWIEPQKWFDDAMDSDESVRHLFLKWDNVLGLTRPIERDKFEDKREYRGLRPRQ
ncbi:MAG TPA: hypothetical protein EYO33_16655 [Phycisphaerales bacterium]|nr:hypothetical protein [Phycisphaerales bacterium]